MDRKKLKQYIFQKYGLEFQLSPQDPGNLEELRISPSQRPFVVLAQTSDCLDLKAPSFASVLQEVDHFGTPMLVNQPGWVEVHFDQASDRDVENVIDYAFQTAMSGKEVVPQQLIRLPRQHIQTQYQAQTIPLKSRPRLKPKKLSPLEKVLRSYDYTVSPAVETAYNFCRQGQMLADFQDDYQPIVEFQRYYPDYHSMNLAQLHTYLTWRTRLRAGDFSVNSTSYAYVYIYELLNNIGVDDAAAGYRLLKYFKDRYAPSYHKKMAAYLSKWMQDYVLYYGLGREQANDAFAEKLAVDRQYHIICHPDEYSDDDLLAVFEHFSTYLKRCRLYQNAKEEFAKLFRYIWQRVLQEQPHQAIAQLIGQQTMTTGYLFANAVFYFKQAPKMQTYVIDSERKYQFKGHQYYCTSWQPCRQRSVKLNAFFHEIDRLGRQAFGLGHPLKARSLDHALLQAIQDGIHDYQRAKQRQAQKEAEPDINLTDLDKIRADASVTRESLLTDEEKNEEHEENVSSAEKKQDQQASAIVPAKNEPGQPNDQHTAEDDDAASLLLNPAPADDDADIDLTADEQFLLQALLTGQPYQDHLKKHHLMLSIMVDQLNDKLFDAIGDTAIEFDDNNRPQIIEDYRPDVQAIINHKEES
ncbi:TerB N-terminal domain-containing protein [Limosilactobacillus sp.]|uniref:TerB N-terminal domain-containing protein n=1 Tax=Limosilactobacillus sp. TaxID=2773925 RepID=UPI00345E1E62